MSDLTRRDPLRSIFAMPRWIDDVDFPSMSSQRGLKIRETEKDIVVEAVIAGVPANDVEVNIEDGVLTIKAERVEEKKDKNEFSTSSYQYYYTTALSGGQWDKADATVEHGIVSITIPKTESSRPQKITVKAK